MDLRFEIQDDTPVLVIADGKGKEVQMSADDEQDWDGHYHAIPRLHELFLGKLVDVTEEGVSEDFWNNEADQITIQSVGRENVRFIVTTHNEQKETVKLLELEITKKEMAKQYIDAFRHMMSRLSPGQIRRMEQVFDFGLPAFESLSKHW